MALKHSWNIALTVAATFFVAALLSCSVIDDDLSDCGNSYELDYELRLVTNMTTELQTQLTTQTDLQLAAALRTHLSNIFTDFAHDVDLSFYDTQGDSIRLQHDQHVMNANQASYTLYLPVRQYMHVAVANVVNNPVVEITSDDYCHQARLALSSASSGSAAGIPDTISSHTTGLFTARLPMNVKEGVDQQFNVHLYMANCASTLVIDTTGCKASNIRLFATGFATAFSLADSIYTFSEHSPIVRSEETHIDDNRHQCFTTVTFPSPEPAMTRIVINTEEPFQSLPDIKPLWEMHAYVTAYDGTTTHTTLYIHEPLRAGQLRIFKGRLHDDGSITTNDNNVGVSVQLNWQQGQHYEPEL